MGGIKGMQEDYISMAGNNYADGLINPAINQKEQATLFFFSPRKIIDHFKRPYTYNFNMEFVETVNNMVTNNQLFGVNNTNRLLGNPVSNSAIVPSMNGFVFNTSMYSTHWTFLLVISDDVSEYDQVKQISNKAIYIGICSEEPLNPNTLNNFSPTLNLNSELYITRKIVFNRIKRYNQKFGMVSGDDLMSDINVYHYDKGIIPNEDLKIFNLSPDNLMTMMSVSADDGKIILNDSKGIGSFQNDSVNTKIETSEASPKKQLRTIANSLICSKELLEYDIDEQRLSEIQVNIPETFKDNVEIAFQNNSIRNGDSIGLESNRHYKLDFIVNTYSPNIQPIITPTETPADVISQKIISPNNLFSALISYTIPSFLARVGIAGISFMYNSYHGASKVLHIDSLQQGNSDDLKYKWKRFFAICKHELFPLLQSGGGHFDLVVNSSMNASTFIKLQFLDENPLPSNAVYEENNFLGGIVSPQIGDTNVMFNNARNIHGLLNYASMGIESTYENSKSKEINPNQISINFTDLPETLSEYNEKENKQNLLDIF